MEWVIDQFRALGVSPEGETLLRVGLALVIGGAFGLHVRFLYLKCSSSVSGADSISGVFPLLTVVIIAVIAVVKSSLALSLGLVGALSIVRFRAAIKDPEELVYLFLCIALGLALGANRFAISVLLLLVASLLIIARRFIWTGSHQQNLLLTVVGDARQYFDDPESGAIKEIRELADSFSIQRYEVEDDRGQVRVIIPKLDADRVVLLIGELRRRLEGCHISFVNMDTIL